VIPSSLPTFSAVVIMVIYGLSAHYGEARYGEQTA
jgi:hypothetical protein